MSVLGGLSAEAFLAEYWQQQPLLVRQALPDYVVPLDADDLAGLALEEAVESRLVLEHGDQGSWELQLGPFKAEDFEALPSTHWTLLVQALDLWLPEVERLLAHFAFLPRWRVDDIMASFAPAGGSVGPHFDQYDVFLLQVSGQRRWQIGDVCDADTPLRSDTPLGILTAFEARQEWLLQPGDMLYLPPRYAHWGVAVDDCMTFSVGFRAPTLADMLSELAVELAAQPPLTYRDPPLTPAMASEQIDPAFITQLRRQLQTLLEDDVLLADWFARYMTQPKMPEWVEQTGERRRARILGRTYENGEPL